MPSPTTNSAVSIVRATGNDQLDSLLSFLKWGKPGAAPATITYSFAGLSSFWSTDKSKGYGPNSGSREPWREGYDQLNSVQRDNVRLALAEFSKVCGLKFVEVRESASSVGDIRFAFTSDIGGFSRSYGPTPNPVGGDIWISDTYQKATFKPGTSEFSQLLGSIGLSLGLTRPDRSNPPLDLEFDHIGNTVTSQVAGPRGYAPVTPMALDVAALTYLYGPNRATAGNTTHVISAANSYEKYRHIADAGGTDTLVFKDYVYSVDLAAGFAMTTPSNSNVVILGYKPSPAPDPGFEPVLLSGLTVSGEKNSYSNITFARNAIENLEVSSGSMLLGSSKDNILTYKGVTLPKLYFDGRGGVDKIITNQSISSYAVKLETNTHIHGVRPGFIFYERFKDPSDYYTQSFKINNVEFVVFKDITIQIDTKPNSGLQIGDYRDILNDTLNGSENIDYLYGLEAADKLYGNGGNDHLYGGNSVDTLYGGDGFDIAHYDEANYGNLTIRLDENPAQGRVSPDIYVSIEGVVGGAGNDDIGGTSGANTLNGMGGNDILRGKGGADTFIFSTRPSATNVDHIRDFSVVDDMIHLDDAIFTALKPGKLPATMFKNIATGKQDADDVVLYRSSTGALYYDKDGAGGEKAVLFAILDTKPANLSAADFLVI